MSQTLRADKYFLPLRWKVVVTESSLRLEKEYWCRAVGCNDSSLLPDSRIHWQWLQMKWWLCGISSLYFMLSILCGFSYIEVGSILVILVASDWLGGGGYQPNPYAHQQILGQIYCTNTQPCTLLLGKLIS